mgnify:CR=1 FL=1
MLRRRGRGRASISLQEMMPEALQPEQLPTLPTTVLSREGTDVDVRPLNTTMRNTLPELSRHRSASTEFVIHARGLWLSRAVAELSRAPPRCAASRPAARLSSTGLQLSSAATGARFLNRVLTF